jgi:hypothetical protein
MKETTPTVSGLLTPSRLILQLGGFAAGTALLVWIVRQAVAEGDFERLRSASPILTIRPLKPRPFWDLQRLNIFCNMLNYAPVRVGAIARVAYHVRIDRLHLFHIGLWFTLIGGILFLGVGACLMASLVHDRIDLWWFAIVAGQLLLGGGLVRLFFAQPLVTRYAHGFERVVMDPTALGGAFILRMVDIGAYASRMAVAAAILEIDLTLTQTVTLAVVALAASVIPIGRVGFREFCVAAVASRLDLVASDVAHNMNQLALVESAGEALFFIPAGIALVLWYRRRWRAGADGDS